MAGTTLFVKQLRVRRRHDFADEADEALARRLAAGLNLREVAFAEVVAATRELRQQPALLLASRFEHIEDTGLQHW